MLPLKDDNPTRRFPVLTVALIALNILLFAYQSTKPNPQTFSSLSEFNASQSGMVCEFGVVPDRVLDGHAPQNDACVLRNEEQGRLVSLVTHQFIHGGWFHLFGNMLFLWIFGNNVEDRLGRMRFLPFFLLCGIVAALGQALTNPESTVPLIGASGAISGVLGAYFVLFPRARVLTIVGIIPLRLPAWIVLGAYIALQFLYIGGQSQAGEGGVAYWAHVFGFVTGAALILPFLAGRRRRGRPRELTL
jgi:membrane associated rhomboid family serine protease